MATILTTRRLRLREWHFSDARSYHRYCNTEAVIKHLGGTVSFRSVRAEVAWFIAEAKRHGHTFWVVERKRDRMFIGFCGIIKVPDRRSPFRGELEIGWRISDDQSRRGYAHEAARAVIAWTAKNKRGQQVIARIAPENRRSQRLARKVGMRERRAWRHADAVDGSVHRVWRLANACKLGADTPPSAIERERGERR